MRSPRTSSSTRSTGDGWAKLLYALTAEELEQYGRLAQDQIRRETRWNWVHAGALSFVATLASWVGFKWFQVGFDRAKLYLLGICALLSYWPIRSFRIRRLWRGHYRAVRRELSRRRARRSERPMRA